MQIWDNDEKSLWVVLWTQFFKSYTLQSVLLKEFYAMDKQEILSDRCSLEHEIVP